MACPQGYTQDGFETQFGTNHLGHFVFVNQLVPLLKPGARIVTLSSAGHQVSDVDLEDPNFERTPYQPFVAYGRSKTANVLYAIALDSRLKGRGVRATSVHPGGIQTELGRHMTAELMEQVRARLSLSTGNQQVPAFSLQDRAARRRDCSMGWICRIVGCGRWPLL
jgi:NAD(P)-dependent dehydrogenase (short-subunit alcohol dehydrogenase family)